MTPDHPPLEIYRQAEFRTSRFLLRPITREDQPQMYQWRSDNQTARFLSAPAPTSLQNQMDWFESIREDPAYCYHIIEDQTEPVGFVSLINLNPALADAEWGVVLGKHRGTGVVRILAPLFCKCALILMQLENIFTCIYHKNIVAIRKMEQVGAVLVDGPHQYRKSSELLFQINATRFEHRIAALTKADPEWKHHLDVEMTIRDRQGISHA